MPETVETFDGWYALHDFRTINWEKWQEASEATREQALEEIYQLAAQWQHIEDEEQGSQESYSIVGQKADILFMFLRPTMRELDELELAWNTTKVTHYTEPAYHELASAEQSTHTQRQTDQ